MPANLSDVGNKAKRTELYRKQKGDKKAEQKDRRKRRAREAQELGEVSRRYDVCACIFMRSLPLLPSTHITAVWKVGNSFSKTAVHSKADPFQERGTRTYYPYLAVSV